MSDDYAGTYVPSDTPAEHEWTERVCASMYGFVKVVRDSTGEGVTIYSPTGPDSWEPDSHYDSFFDATVDFQLDPLY